MDKFEEIKREFGDCDWMRAVFNEWTVDSIQWMIAEIESLRTFQSFNTDDVDLSPRLQKDASRSPNHAG